MVETAERALPCRICGGRVVPRLRASPPALTNVCADCPESTVLPLALSPPAREIAAEVVEARARLRVLVRPPRPVVLLWLPPAPEMDDTYAMIRERLASGDPCLIVRGDLYPDSPDDPRAAEGCLADFLVVLTMLGMTDKDC